MNRIILIIIITVILSGCGKKSAPVYKSENQKENIIKVS
tara:strand:- start:187 stop:303 length:117 start_codon:yes stop_codon:yes gene_type:complete